MNKKQLSERDICTKYITPALEKAGWDVATQIREELPLTKGRIIVRGKLHTRAKHKRADFDEARYFIGIGPDYKELLLAVLLMQPDTCKVRQFICQKLGIETVASEATMVLERPAYAADSRFDIELNDETDRYWKPEGITKTFLDPLHGCINTATGSPVCFEGYFSPDDRYTLYFDGAKIRQEFADLSRQELFRQFDNLRTLGMLAEITIPLQLTGGVNATIAHFSDGQFQSVYIYSIVELFRDRNCITLLDETDSFLHPEWQFDFLKQIFEITDTTAKNNHVLMSSHSAVTLIPHDKKKIKFFDIKGNQANCHDLPKSVAIKKLSADLIKYSEQEQLLSIINAIQIENKPVLFTEGSTEKGMIKKWAEGESYALMLPVPANADIQKQVIRDPVTGETFGGDSCCEIEHLFYGLDSTKNYYQHEPCVGGTKIVFKSDGEKTSFAREVVPALDQACFEVFCPMFEFIKSKCPAGVEGEEVAP
jgi:hypothetical protein